MKLCLASQSPRRRELLQQIGIDHETVRVEVDEHWDGSEPPRAYVQRLALEKARAGRRLSGTEAIVLGADTAVIIDNDILGKATSPDQAREMLWRLSGRTHEVMSAVAIIDTREHCRLNISRVSFRPLSDAEVETYCDSGEGVGKAGGYAIQGRAAALITRLDGSYSGVMGLPLYETSELLAIAGIKSV